MEVISIIMVGIVIVAVTVFFMRPDKTTQLVAKAYKKYSRRIPSLLNLAFLPDQSTLSNEQKRLIATLTDSEWEEWEELIVKVSAIANAFPATFDEFLKECYPDIPKRNLYKEPSSKNSPIKTTLPNKIECLTLYELRSIESEPKEVWEKRDQERIEASTLLNKCPEGGKDYISLRQTLFVSSAEILRNKERILNKQKRYHECRMFDGWEKKQESFCSDIWNVNKKFLPNNGRYTYMVPFQKPKIDGTLEMSEFKIWQFFNASYSSFYQEEQSEHYRNMLSKIPEFANKKRYYYDNVYDGVYSFIEGITNTFVEKPLILFITSNSKEWSKEAFDYHYKHLRSRLDENEYTWCNLNDIQSINENTIYKSVLIIDFISTNDEMKKNSAYVIEFFKQSIPFVCYFSLIKEYDEFEFKKIIEDIKAKEKTKKTVPSNTIKPEGKEKEPILEDYMLQNRLFIKQQYERVIKHPFFSYMAITNSLVGEAQGAEYIMPVWLTNHSTYKFRTMKGGSNKISGSYSIDGGKSYTDLIMTGDSASFDDQVSYATLLFYRMGVIDLFLKNGRKAIDALNVGEYLRYH